jgi:hypothetical protein
MVVRRAMAEGLRNHLLEHTLREDRLVKLPGVAPA